jgi:hypothetical protein
VRKAVPWRLHEIHVVLQNRGQVDAHMTQIVNPQGEHVDAD